MVRRVCSHDEQRLDNQTDVAPDALDPSKSQPLEASRVVCDEGESAVLDGWVPRVSDTLRSDSSMRILVTSETGRYQK